MFPLKLPTLRRERQLTMGFTVGMLSQERKLFIEDMRSPLFQQ